MFHDNFADDLITIKSSSDPDLNHDASRGVKWVYLELQKKLQNNPNIAISFERFGKYYNLEKASDMLEITRPNPFLAKILSFRKVYPENECSW